MTLMVVDFGEDQYGHYSALRPEQRVRWDDWNDLHDDEFAGMIGTTYMTTKSVDNRYKMLSKEDYSVYSVCW